MLSDRIQYQQWNFLGHSPSETYLISDSKMCPPNTSDWVTMRWASKSKKSYSIQAQSKNCRHAIFERSLNTRGPVIFVLKTSWKIKAGILKRTWERGAEVHMKPNENPITHLKLRWYNWSGREGLGLSPSASQVCGTPSLKFRGTHWTVKV